MSERLPCPFCGNANSTRRYGPDNMFWIECDDCRARGPESREFVDPSPTTRWNHRSPSPSSGVDVEASGMEWIDGQRRYEIRHGALWIKVAPDPVPHGEWHMVDRKDALPVLVRRVAALSPDATTPDAQR